MKHFYCLLTVVLSFSTTNAQFTLEVENAAYEEIESGTSITNGLIWEELEADMPLGFSFTLGEYTFDTVHLTYDTTEGILLPSLDFSQPFPAVCAVIGEYADRNALDPTMIGQPGGVSDVSYTTVGDAGARVFILQYKNLGFENDIWTNEESIDYVNFQLRLYEGTNKIAYHFGPSDFSNFNVSYEDVSGPAIGLFGSLQVDNSLGYIDIIPVEDSYFILGDNTNPYLAVVTPEALMNTGDIFYTGFPQENTKFILTQTNLSTQDYHNKPLYQLENNPVDSFLTLNTIKDILEIEVYDVSGKKVLSTQTIIKNIPVQHLNSGIYLLKIKTRGGLISKKFIKK